MMRQITVDFTKPIPCENNIAGRIGEHNATELIIIPPEFLSANETVSHYVAAFAVECNVIHSAPIPKTAELNIPLWSQLTQSEYLTVQLEGYDSAGVYIGKSEPVRLRLLHSACGEEMPADTDNPDFISDYLKNRHSHSNKEVLDNFSEDEEGNPLYNGSPIGGGSGLTDEQTEDLAANTEARHEHSNKGVLDKFTVDENGDLSFNGTSVGDLKNVTNNKALAAQIVATLFERYPEVLVSTEAPEVASKEDSLFANFMSYITTPVEYDGSKLLYAPSDYGNITYLDPMAEEVKTFAVEDGFIYEFYVNAETWELEHSNYTDEAIFEFLKDGILKGYTTEAYVDELIEQALKEGDYAKKYDLVNYRHISQKVPASEVSYSNGRLADSSGTIEGALDEAVDYVIENVPALAEAKHSHDNKTVLDKIGENENGDMLYNGSPINSEGSLKREIVNILPKTEIIVSTVYMIKNKLPFATDENGVIYNETGYKVNTEFSYALDEETDSDGICLSGFIPFWGEEVIRIGNITMNKESDKTCRIFFFDENKTWLFTMNAEALTDSCNAQWDENGNLAEFTAPSSDFSQFFRIQAAAIDDNSSVVIDNGDSNIYEEYVWIDGSWERLGGTQIDLSKYAKSKDIPTKTSQLDNDSGFVTDAEMESSIESALADAKESGDFDGYTPVKGTDYFTEADKAEIVEEVVASIGSVDAAAIPAYWQTALDEGVEAINTAMTTAGYNKSAFLFYSDVHWNYGSQMSPKLLKYLYQHTAMTKTNFGGDIVNDEAADYDSMSYLWEWRNQIKDLPNHHSVVGNHDDGNSTNNLFSEQYVYGYLLAAEETSGIVRDESGLYYYIDNSPEKTRYLYLDTAYKGATDEQVAFVKEALLSTPEGWHIVAISHIWHDTIYSGANREVGDLNANASILLAMFDNYNSRIGDYADCGGWVEFCIGGHTHLDHDSTSSTGIPIILVATDSQHTGGGASFTYGTDTEASVNGIIADYDNHKIYVVRIGRGESREIEVTNYVVTYTNVLPTSIDIDGSVYNGTGYKANTRWSTSSSAEITTDGVYLSGYIPVSSGDIIRFKNIIMDKNAAVSNTCKIMMYSALGAYYGDSDATNLTAYNDAVWDDSGILTQFSIDSGTYSYIRLQAAYIGADSIVTVNEPIE